MLKFRGGIKNINIYIDIFSHKKKKKKKNQTAAKEKTKFILYWYLNQIFFKQH